MSTLALKQSQKPCLRYKNPRNGCQRWPQLFNGTKNGAIWLVAKMMIVRCQPRLDNTPFKSCQLAVIHINCVCYQLVITWLMFHCSTYLPFLPPWTICPIKTLGGVQYTSILYQYTNRPIHHYTSRPSRSNVAQMHKITTLWSSKNRIHDSNTSNVHLGKWLSSNLAILSSNQAKRKNMNERKQKFPSAPWAEVSWEQAIERSCL